MTHMNKNGRYKQRFSLRKYKFGAASVLLGTLFALGMTGTTAEAQHHPLSPGSPGAYPYGPGSSGYGPGDSGIYPGVPAGPGMGSFHGGPYGFDPSMIVGPPGPAGERGEMGQLDPQVLGEKEVNLVYKVPKDKQVPLEHKVHQV